MPAKPGKPAKPAFEVRHSDTAGRGVFATRAIKAGEFVLSLTGEKLPGAKVGPQHFAVKIDDDLWLCSPGGRTDDYLNHHCSPNLGFARGNVRLYALRDIAPGEELSFDYSTAMFNVDGWHFTCACRARHCRKRVGGFETLSPAQKRRLRDRCLAYIKRAHRA